MSAALSQLIDSQEKDLGVSKVLSKSEKKYLVTRKEFLAVFTFISISDLSFMVTRSQL